MPDIPVEGRVIVLRHCPAPGRYSALAVIFAYAYYYSLNISLSIVLARTQRFTFVFERDVIF